MVSAIVERRGKNKNMDKTKGQKGLFRAIYCRKEVLAVTEPRTKGWREKIAEWTDRANEWLQDIVPPPVEPVPVPVRPSPRKPRPHR